MRQDRDLMSVRWTCIYIVNKQISDTLSTFEHKIQTQRTGQDKMKRGAGYLTGHTHSRRRVKCYVQENCM